MFNWIKKVLGIAEQEVVDTFVSFKVHAKKEIADSEKALAALKSKLQDGVKNMAGVVQHAEKQIAYYADRKNQAADMQNEYLTHLQATDNTLGTIQAIATTAPVQPAATAPVADAPATYTADAPTAQPTAQDATTANLTVNGGQAN
jgi:hypothetical protein